MFGGVAFGRVAIGRAKVKIINGSAFRTGSDWGAWFRFFGYGFAVSTMEPMFSERYHFRRVIRILGIKIEWLHP